MKYIIVRTYGNGKHMNKVYPMYFEWLSQAEKVCEKLTECDNVDDSNRWVVMPITEYVGEVW